MKRIILLLSAFLLLSASAFAQHCRICPDGLEHFTFRTKNKKPKTQYEMDGKTVEGWIYLHINRKGEWLMRFADYYPDGYGGWNIKVTDEYTGKFTLTDLQHESKPVFFGEIDIARIGMSGKLGWKLTIVISENDMVDDYAEIQLICNHKNHMIKAEMEEDTNSQINWCRKIYKLIKTGTFFQ